ncbi:hypothetical protein [Pararhizobium antarcticum]|uniref:hypothetical protein n=1 Tax=Pararhizobium antarcticum TaxID=1798805 RepID=UPI000AE2A257|nr:hypothetical protein [Pararhizobium antarcticum]
MSNEIEYATRSQEAAFAFLFNPDNMDELTDILVDALEDAFRILGEEISAGTLN